LRIYAQLDEKEQEEAVYLTLNELLKNVIEGSVVFNDEANGDSLQLRIDAAVKEATQAETPWFASMEILDTCREELKVIATHMAKESLYPSNEKPLPPFCFGIRTKGAYSHVIPTATRFLPNRDTSANESPPLHLRLTSASSRRAKRPR